MTKLTKCYEPILTSTRSNQRPQGGTNRSIASKNKYNIDIADVIITPRKPTDSISYSKPKFVNTADVLKDFTD